MTTGTKYDDSAFIFFASTLLFCFFVPSAYYVYSKWHSFKHGPQRALAAVPLLQPRSEAERAVVERHKLRAARVDSPVLWTPGFRCFSIATAVAGVLLLLCIVIAVRSPSLATYDPYAILETVTGAGEKEIRAAYRKLSLRNHPDKGGDAAVFQKIAKAYEALSNPVARANWEKYGNPDGPQAMEAAIGLPSFLVHPVGRYVFLLSYMLILLLVVPYVLYSYFKSRGSSAAGSAAERLAAELKAAPAGHSALREALALELVDLDREARLKDAKRTRGLAPESVGWLASHLDHMLAGELNVLQIVGGVLEAVPRAPWGEGDVAELRDALAELAVVHKTTGMRMPPNLTFNAAMPPMTPAVIDANRVLLYSHLWRRHLSSDALRWHREAYVSLLPDALLTAQAHGLHRIWQQQQIRDTPPERMPQGAPKFNRRWLGGGGGFAFLASLSRLSALVVQALPDRQVLEGTAMPLAYAQAFTAAEYAHMVRSARGGSGARAGLRSFGHLLRLGREARGEYLREAVGEGAEAGGAGAAQRVAEEAARLERVLGDVPVLEGSVHAFVRAAAPFGWVAAAGGGEGYVRDPAVPAALLSGGGAGAPDSFASLEALRAHCLAADERAGVTQVNHNDNVTLRVRVRHANLMGSEGRGGGAGGAAAAAAPARGADAYLWMAGNDAPAPRGPALPLVHAPHFHHMLREQWSVWVEDTATKRLVIPAHWNPQLMHGQVFSPSQGEECMDIFLGQQLRVGRNALTVHFASPHYLGIEPEEGSFSITIQVNAKAHGADEEEEEEDSGDEEEEDTDAPFTAESFLSSFIGGAAVEDNGSDVTEDELEEREEEEALEDGPAGAAAGGAKPSSSSGGGSKGGKSPAVAGAAAAAAAAASAAAAAAAAAEASKGLRQRPGKGSGAPAAAAAAAPNPPLAGGGGGAAVESREEALDDEVEAAAPSAAAAAAAVAEGEDEDDSFAQVGGVKKKSGKAGRK